jgi:ankyrin repeat protein
MNKFGPDCSIKFIKMPHRLDLKFEKSFAMAVQKNKNDVLLLFPPRSIHTAYIGLHQLRDYKQYKEDKSKDLLTTALHIACQNSNIEAVRILIEQQNFDVNVLVNEKNFIVELLTNSGYMDFSIMNIIFKKCRPQINSGCKLALNQAILRGNPFMIKTLLELGNPNPFAVDKAGKAPIHIAVAKLDIDTIDALVKHGADPMMPDADGNTVLHIMALGTVKDKEYDFIKMLTVRHGLRLTRNKEGRTPLHIIRANSAQGVMLRG